MNKELGTIYRIRLPSEEDNMYIRCKLQCVIDFCLNTCEVS